MQLKDCFVHALRTKVALCPSCHKMMRLSRVTLRFDGLPNIYAFECRACGKSHVEAA
jgi:uncharacterized protein CbrC (UPF0167 family)